MIIPPLTIQFLQVYPVSGFDYCLDFVFYSRKAAFSFSHREKAIKYSCKLLGRYIDTFPTLDELARFYEELRVLLGKLGHRGGFHQL